MPNRIIKESICVSDDINGLSWFEEVLFYRLIVNCDDYGRYDGRVAIIKNKLFPLKDNLTTKTVENGINTLARIGLVVLYSFEGKPYLYLPSWNHHQRLRASVAKYPSPDNSEIDNLPQVAASCGEMPLESESESESESEYQSEEYSPEQTEFASVPPLPLNDGSEFPITVKQLSEWKELYPAVDVEQELRNMRGWCNANPKRRKTKSGIMRFIASWLSKEQDKGGAVKQTSKTPPPSYDINRAVEKANTTVPKFKKKER